MPLKTKEELHKEMAEELDKPISTIGSIKFFTDPMLSTLKKEEIIKIVSNHITKLEEQKAYWEKWYGVKVDKNAMGITGLSFQMTIQSIGDQILWHQELLEHIDEYIKLSKETEHIIRSFDFDKLDANHSLTEEEEKLQYTIKLKNEILKDPGNAVTNLDKIIEELQKQIKK